LDRARVRSIEAGCPGDESFVFLDTARPSAGHTRSYLFREPALTVTARRFEEVEPALAEVERLARGRWLAGFVAYEAAYALEERLAPLREAVAPAELPLLWFGAFDRPHLFDHRTGVWEPPLSPAAPGVPRDLAPAIRHTLRREEYARAVGAIKKWIGRGHTYQANFTYDVTLDCDAEPFELYRHLRDNQATPLCSFIRTPFGDVASFSPELFFRRRGAAVTVKPMKGTAPRGRYPDQDRGLARWLAADPKNRAENVMIVDLLRNDLGRVCRPGTVHTTALFEIETHPTVHQMTSTVRGTLRRGVGLTDLFRTLFPCGSVTGAPKIRTMEILRALERGPRGVYYGAIGCVAPGGRADFSVPIRTLQRKAGSRHWRYRVGSGIVWGSSAAREWKECADKCAFLVRRPRRFELLETILYHNGFRFLQEHRDRLRSSAGYFGYPLDRRELTHLLAAVRAALARGRSYRVRLLLAPTGALRWESAPIEPSPPRSTPAAHLSPMPIDEQETLLYHKTTHRPWYDDAAERIAAGECYDVLFTNRRGELTEGARNNLFVRIDGELVTPPVSCGLLGGVLRRRMLARGECRERILRPRDLRRAEAVYCGNSVRGLVRVRVEPPPSQSRA
jgi:para-aminobenzoate synthetase/4-amino-4-deoxychorismate lyase